MTCMCDFCFSGQQSGVKSSPKILDQITTPRVPYNGNMLYEVANVPPTHQTNVTSQQLLQSKDYSRPLHVDCSVEYELPSQVKPPPTSDGKSDPLLMIHPCYFRKIEAQRRSPFINNLPAGRVLPAVASSCRQATPTHTMSSAIQPQQPSRNIQSSLIHRSGNLNASSTSSMPNNQIQYPSNHFSNSQCQWPEQIQVHPVQQSGHHYKSTSSVGKSNPAALQVSSASSCAATGLYGTGLDAGASVSGLWSNTTNHSPLAAERFPDPLMSVVNHPSNSNKHNNLLASKYRQYLRTQRLHPYMCVSSSAFPQMAQMQQIPCYNV